ncbi:cysteine protease ATG4B-like isoform X2 [Amphiura filiformis]|uniref:cysteine protease ATG4B-like isoform X2 n=1 Tax=Amphiura filiformis TaxID=82378 RepID=UPI003B2114EE
MPPSQWMTTCLVSIMIAMSCVTYESGMVAIIDFPHEDKPVWILGKQYNLRRERQEAQSDVRSRLWVSYRKGFAHIGGTGPTSDQGWGCMLRCGQMMLAQALICRHLGRDWRWNPDKEDAKYIKILKMFLDRKDSCYSIQQIAQMGVGEGKSIGQWFGPNTVSQVLKKLSVFDEWSNIGVHVALDNTIVKDDIRTLCLQCNNSSNSSISSTPNPNPHTLNGSIGGASCESASASSGQRSWRPLVLLIPLRLGLNEINNVYIERLKRCFMLRHSLGVIGGKPNHAHYFIGFLDDELVYLDPHTTQPCIHDDKWGNIPDDSYHCEQASRMKIQNLDPSIALGFYFHTEEDFEDWCVDVQKVIYEKDLGPMFELTEHRPSHWPPFASGQDMESFQLPLDITELDDIGVEPRYDSEDEEFELL